MKKLLATALLLAAFVSTSAQAASRDEYIKQCKAQNGTEKYCECMVDAQETTIGLNGEHGKDFTKQTELQTKIQACVKLMGQ